MKQKNWTSRIVAAALATMLVGGVGLGLLWKSDTVHDAVVFDGVGVLNSVTNNALKDGSDDKSANDITEDIVAKATAGTSEDVRFTIGNKYFVVSSQVVDGEPVGFSIKVEDKIKETNVQPSTLNAPLSSAAMLGKEPSTPNAPLGSAALLSKEPSTFNPQRSPINAQRSTSIPHTRFYQRFSAGLMASNFTMADSRNTTGLMMNLASNGKMMMRSPAYLSDFEERTEHKAPFTLGLKLGYSITPRLWVESGVQYSKLSSTFVREMRGSELTSEQALHYVGVPLGVGYRIFDVGPLSFYGIAGAKADFNVKAKSSIGGVETETAKDDVQFSANASLGAQVKLTPHLGIYVEPGARYYFDNGSNVQNYFKDKKLNFDLQVGARWNIGGKSSK